MAGQDDKAKSLEMRVAELEDKLARLNVTEEEMRAYEKVSSLMGGTTEAAGSHLSPQLCSITRQRLVCINRSIIPRQIVRFCYECTCGPCNCISDGGFSGGGGFGGFGM
jgi:hypothetical protein